MTTITYNGDTLKVDHEGHIKHLTPVQFYSTVCDFDLHETAVKAIAARGEAIPVPTSSYARGLKPRNAKKLGVCQ